MPACSSGNSVTNGEGDFESYRFTDGYQSDYLSVQRVVVGATTGLIGLGETVTRSAVHFCIWQELTVEIVEFERPHLFADRMTDGAFKSMRHRHAFEASGDETIMRDHFAFEAPLGILGIIAKKLVLGWYMRRFLEIRNARLKVLAEGNEWSRFLTE